MVPSRFCQVYTQNSCVVFPEYPYLNPFAILFRAKNTRKDFTLRKGHLRNTSTYLIFAIVLKCIYHSVQPHLLARTFIVRQQTLSRQKWISGTVLVWPFDHFSMGKSMLMSAVELQNLSWYKTGFVSRHVLHLLSRLHNWICPKTGQYKTCIVSNTKIEISIRAAQPKPWQSHLTSGTVWDSRYFDLSRIDSFGKSKKHSGYNYFHFNAWPVWYWAMP